MQEACTSFRYRLLTSTIKSYKMNIKKNMENGLDTKEVARLVKFIIDTPKDVMIPEVGIKNINN